MKRIKTFAFDNRNFELLFIRERCVEPTDKYEMYALNIRRNLDPRYQKKPKYPNLELQDCASLVASFAVFTQPISVFTTDDHLTVSACYDVERTTAFVMVSSPALSLLYRADVALIFKHNKNKQFD